MADPKPPRQGVELIVDKIGDVRRTAEDLATASGTERDNTVKKLKAAIEELQRIQAEQAVIIQRQGEQQAQLENAQAALAAQVAFLQGITSYAANGGVLSEPRGASGGISLDGYNPSLDCQVTLRTTSTGKLTITVGANLAGSEGISAVLGYEVLWAGGSIPIDWTRSAAAGSGASTTSRTSFVTVPPNTDVTVRTRRGWQGGQGGICIWAYQSLQVSKEGQ